MIFFVNKITIFFSEPIDSTYDILFYSILFLQKILNYSYQEIITLKSL